MTSKQKSSVHSTGRGERAVLAVFPRTAKVKELRADQRADLLVNGQAIEVKWIGSGHLGDVRAAQKKRPRKNVVFAARQMSPGARAALSEAGINWVDETGAAEIAIGTVVVSKSGMPGKKPDGIRQWTPAVIAVAEALLCGIRGTQSEAQSATGLSAGSCANALRFLSDQKLLRSTAKRGPASGRRIADQRALLDAYVAAVAARPSGIELEIAVAWQDILQGVSKLGYQFDARGVAWAVTGGAAAALIAPHISSLSRAVIYVDAQSIAELEKLALLSKLRPLEGGRLILKPFPTRTVERLVDLETGGLRIAPWPRVYADLVGEGVRGEEAAEHMYELINARRSS